MIKSRWGHSSEHARYTAVGSLKTIQKQDPTKLVYWFWGTRGSQIISVMAVCGPQVQLTLNERLVIMAGKRDIYIKGSSGYLSKGGWRGQKMLRNQSLEDQAFQPGSPSQAHQQPDSLSFRRWCVRLAPPRLPSREAGGSKS